MIEKMSKYSFILLPSGKEGFLEKLQELGLVDITRSEKPVDERSSELFDRIAARKLLISDIEKGSDYTLRLLQESLAALRAEAGSIRVWGEWDREALARTGISLHFYCVPAKKYNPEWEKDYAIQIVESVGNCWFVIAGDKAGFPVKELPAPTKDLAVLEADISRLEDDERNYRESLEARKAELPALRRELARMEEDFSRALASAAAEGAAEGSLCVFEGFAPSEDDASLREAFDAMDIVWFAEKASVEDNPPISFRNNRFVKMFELLTDMYGRPAYNGFDPTPFIAVFFLLFFAFCMGDAGYGIILIIIGWLLGRGEGMKDLSPLVMTLGAGTVLVGFFFHTFFSMDIAEWGIFAPIKGIFLPSKIAGYDGTMILSLAIGVLHLCLAMVIKTVVATKQRGFLGSLGVWGWTLLIVGGVAVAAFALAGVLDKEITQLAVIVLGVVSGAGIFLFNDIHRNPLANIGSGLWETYNTVTGLLGDVLSYLRLYALGLAGAMLGKAFNDIGAMVLGDGSSFISWIPFILIVLIGHVLNIAMAALGAFVHPLRLNFLEFFKNSGYEAAGRNYNPLKKQ